MIKIDNTKLEVEGKTCELVSETQIIIESLFESMNIIEQYAFTRAILKSLDRGLDRKEESDD